MFSVRLVELGIEIRNQHETVKALFAGLADNALVESLARMLALPGNVAARPLQAIIQRMGTSTHPADLRRGPKSGHDGALQNLSLKPKLARLLSQRPRAEAIEDLNGDETDRGSSKRRMTFSAFIYKGPAWTRPAPARWSWKIRVHT